MIEQDVVMTGDLSKAALQAKRHKAKGKGKGKLAAKSKGVIKKDKKTGVAASTTKAFPSGWKMRRVPKTSGGSFAQWFSPSAVMYSTHKAAKAAGFKDK